MGMTGKHQKKIIYGIKKLIIYLDKGSCEKYQYHKALIKLISFLSEQIVMKNKYI